MIFFVSAIYFDWAKGKVGVHQLSVLEQILKSDDEFLKGICIFEFDGPVDDSSENLMGMCVDYGMFFFAGALVVLEEGRGLLAFLFCLFDGGLRDLRSLLPSALSSMPCIILVRCKLMAGLGTSTVMASLSVGLGETVAVTFSALLFSSSSIHFLSSSSCFLASSSSLHCRSCSFFFSICCRRCSSILRMLSRSASCFSFIWRSRSECVIIIVTCRGLGAGRGVGEKCHVVDESKEGGLYKCHVVNVFKVF